MQKHFLYIVFFLGCFNINALSQSFNAPVLSNITEQNGLSDDHVQCVLKDKQGLVWVGTADGLNLIDGSTIRIFKHLTNDTNSLGNNDIRCITEDRNGTVWIGTAGGLSWYQKDKQGFSSAQPPLSPYGAAIFVNSIVIDKANAAWCCTSGGLFRFERTTKQFIPFYIPNKEHNTDILLANRLTFMMSDSQGLLWICSADGAWTFDPAKSCFTKEIYPEKDPKYNGLFLYAFEDHDKKIWLGKWENNKLLQPTRPPQCRQLYQ